MPQLDAHGFTDKQIERIEKEIGREYRRAAREMRAKLKTYREKFHENKWDRAKGMSAEAYQKWLDGQLKTMRWFDDMIDGMALTASNAAERAAAITNGYLPGTIAYCTNYATYEVEKACKINTMWTMVNEDTVSTIIADHPDMFKDIKPKGEVTYKWNAGKFRSALTQGILQGESIPDVAKRIAEVLEMDEVASVRAARTAMTGAESAGTLLSHKRAEAMGIEVMSEWRSTLDGRTRSSHRALMGERVRPGEKFSNGCTRPGDPEGPAGEVYNCRCALVPWIGGIDYSKGDQWFYDETIEGQSFEEWGGKRRDYSQQRKAPEHTMEELEGELAKAKKEAEKATKALEKKATYTRSVQANIAQAKVHRVETQIAQLKAEQASSVEVIKAELVTAQGELKVAQQEVADIKGVISSLNKSLPQDKTYTKLLHGKPTVKTSDWTKAMDDELQDSWDYYEKKAQEAKAAGDTYQYDWYKKKQKQCEELGIEGEEYAKAVKSMESSKASYEAQLQAAEKVLDEAKAKVEGLKAQIKDIDPDYGKPTGAVFGQQRWDDAYDFKSAREADTYLRPEAGRAWIEAAEDEREAIYTYTGGSYRYFNRPLNGYEGNYSSGSFKGVGVADIDEGGYGERIRRMTDMIEHCRLQDDVVLVRGDGYSSLDTVFGFEPGHFSGDTTQEEWDSLVGVSGRVGSFMSCGSANSGGTGFSGKVKFHILAPEGTHAMYVEPISMNGNGIGLSWDGKSKQRNFGGEDETIIQRGGSYTCIKAKKVGYGNLEIWLEHHPEDGYDLFQQ